MAERLAAAGHDVHLLTYGQGTLQSGRGYRHHRVARVPSDDSRRSGPNAAKPLLDAMLTARLVSLVREHAIEIVHAHNYEAAIAALAARAVAGAPVVYHSHNLMGDELETYFEAAPARRLAAIAGACSTEACRRERIARSHCASGRPPGSSRPGAVATACT